MSIFQNNFFSLEGQKERLQNVANTLKSALTLKGVQSNTGIKPIDTALSNLASNPYLTALGGSILSKPSIATQAIKEVSTGIASTTLNYVKTKPLQTMIGGSLVAGVLTSNPKIIKDIPTSSFKVGQDIGNITANPSISGLKDFASKHPFVTGALITAGGVGLLKGGSYLTGYMTGKLSEQKDKNETELVETPMEKEYLVTDDYTKPIFKNDKSIFQRNNSNEYTEQPLSTGYLIEDKPKTLIKRTKKTKHLNRSSDINNKINIKNQIIFSKNFSKNGKYFY